MAEEMAMTSPDNRGYAIEVRGLTKNFGDRPVLNGLELRVERGSRMVIFGPNGSGKTTLIKVLAAIYRPSAGDIRVGGLNVGEESKEVRRLIGVVGHQTYLYPGLTVGENLRFYSRMYGLSDVEGRIHELIASLGLRAHLNERAANLSRGMQQRASIARALVHDPAVLLLDEPETGLDRHAVGLFGEVLEAAKTELKTAVMTTHNLDYGLEIADSVAVIAGGRIAYQSPRSDLDVDAFLGTYQKYAGAGS